MRVRAGVRVLVAAGTGAGVLVGGCGVGAAQTTPAESGLVLAKRVDGGIAPSTVPLRAPDFALYADGRAVESSRYRPTDARIAWLTGAAVRRIAARAAELGLGHGRVVHGSGMVADGFTVRLAFAHDGRRDTTTVEPESDAGLEEFARGLSLDAIARTDLRTAPKPYTPSRVAVVTERFTGPSAPPRAWPLASPRAVPGLDRACRAYAGAAARRALGLLDERNRRRQAPWMINDHAVRLIALPLLPYEKGCTDLAERP